MKILDRIVFAVALLSLIISIGLCIEIKNMKEAREERALEREETEVVEVAEEATEEPELILLGEYEATAYCPCSKCCGKWASGITATGTTAEAGRTIAVDPTVIPYGSKVVLVDSRGFGHEYIAEDCGGAIKGNRVDIYFDTHDEALQFGRQKMTAYLVKE